MINPKRGEIWLIDLNPTRGQELQKTRPAIVISTDLFQTIALRIIIPITTWQDKFINRPFMVKISVAPQNGLTQESAANTLQIRSLSTKRFVRRLGKLETSVLQEILAGLAICIDFDLDEKTN